jgi:hypothetical protein
MHPGDHIDILPSEIRNIVFSSLNYTSFYNLRLTCKTYYDDIKSRQTWNDCFIKTETLETIRDVAFFYDDDILLKQTLNNLANEKKLLLNSHLIFGPCKKCLSLFSDKNFANKLSITGNFIQRVLDNAVHKGNSDVFRLCVYLVTIIEPCKELFCLFLIRSQDHPKFLKILLKSQKFDNFWASTCDLGRMGICTPLVAFLRLCCDTHVKLMLNYKKELCLNAAEASHTFSKILFSKSESRLSTIKILFQICDAKDLIQKCNTEAIERFVYCICHNKDKEFMEQLISDGIFKCITSWDPSINIIFNDVYRMFVMNVLNL